jgi:hypothetical protein
MSRGGRGWRLVDDEIGDKRMQTYESLGVHWLLPIINARLEISCAEISRKLTSRHQPTSGISAWQCPSQSDWTLFLSPFIHLH